MSFGSELRRRRLASGYSLGRFAKSLNYSKSHLSRIETGAKAPSSDLARRCDAALQANGALAALVAERTSGRNERPPLPQPRTAPDGHWQIRLDRNGGGEFNAAPAAAPLTWTMPAAVLGAGTLAHFRAMFDLTRQLGQTTPPALVLPALIPPTRLLSALAEQARAGARAEYFGLASRYAELTGWMAQEAGAPDRALWWTDLAVALAAEGEDQDLAAFALVRRADVAMYERRSAETLAFAQMAQARCHTTRVRGFAAQREAQGHALAGDRRACFAALDRAATCFDHPLAAGPISPLGSTTIDSPVEMATGWCLYDLGSPKQAADHLRRQLDRLPPNAVRMRARLGARLALSLIAAGELEEGCAETRVALDSFTQCGSATVGTELRRLGKQLNRWPTHASVREVLPELARALATQSQQATDNI